VKRVLVRGRLARLSRLVASALLAICLVASVPATAAASGNPTRLQRLVWNVACEYVAKGTVSPQVALVCVHSGFPMWEARSLKVLQVLCERGLHGTYDYRSEYPSEFAACFFN
jgi:hypothetical protein